MYIEAQEASMWGEDFDQEYLEGDQNRGPFELPGYSDKRRAFEVARAKGERPTPLSHRFQYVRTMGADGKPNRQKVAEFSQKGYRLVEGIEDARSLGLEIDERITDITPEGFIQSGDQILMVIDARGARTQEMLHEQQVAADDADRLAKLHERAHAAGTELHEDIEEVTDENVTDKPKGKPAMSDRELFGK